MYDPSTPHPLSRGGRLLLLWNGKATPTRDAAIQAASETPRQSAVGQNSTVYLWSRPACETGRSNRSMEPQSSVEWKKNYYRLLVFEKCVELYSSLYLNTTNINVLSPFGIVLTTCIVIVLGTDVSIYNFTFIIYCCFYFYARCVFVFRGRGGTLGRKRLICGKVLSLVITVLLTLKFCSLLYGNCDVAFLYSTEIFQKVK